MRVLEVLWTGRHRGGKCVTEVVKEIFDSQERRLSCSALAAAPRRRSTKAPLQLGWRTDPHGDARACLGLLFSIWIGSCVGLRALIR